MKRLIAGGDRGKSLVCLIEHLEPRLLLDAGLLGEYFNEINLTSSAGTRVDAQINFPNDALGANAGGMVNGDDNYSIRWTGYVQTPQAGSWQFTTFSNDGVRLWVAGTQLINHWNQHVVAEDNGTISLGAGWHPITLEYFQQGGTAHIQLMYSGPGFTEAVIPSSRLSTQVVTGKPTADAGPDRHLVLPANSTTLDGSGSFDPDGVITAWQWTKQSGPAATMSGANTATLSLSNLVQGTYVFRLTVTDNDGKTGWDEATVTVSPEGSGAAVVTGELKQWHKVTFTWAGPNTSESATPNPFLNYRLNVTFTGPSGQTFVVPGYFAADGNAANTGATGGNKWRCHLAPDEAGQWAYSVSFRTGSNVAINLSPSAGSSAGHMDGDAGTFSVAATDKTGRDLRGKGLLEYVGEHYYRFAGTGEYFLKQGADSPENLLAYDDFDNTPNNGGYRKSWSPHAGDWNAGDPSWAGGKGTELIGAVNYLAEEGMNAISFLTMNINGDDKNVYPYVSTSDRTRIDVSKVAQWEIVFEHANNNGFFLHFKTQETENDQLLDGGALGTERKLYYRELVARFGHHLALNWNLGEENTNTDAQRKQFCDYFEAIDPYNHPVVVHTYPGDHDSVYNPLLGYPTFEGPSIQTDASNTFNATKTWVGRSASNGRKWVVCNDEQGNANTGIKPDSADAAHDGVRKDVLWGNLMAGGGGNEYYFGYSYSNSDLTCQDFRSRDLWWDQCRYALEFFSSYLPYWQMRNDNGISSASNDYALFQSGAVYAIYLKNGGTTNLNLSGVAGAFEVKWYDPRHGGALQNGTVTSVSGGSSVSLGQAPNSTGSDWAILVRPEFSAVVAARHVFYNASSLDGSDPAASAADDNAIAFGKRALTPGAVGGAENITAYSKGLNGIMVDVFSLADAGGLSLATVGDYFDFRSGSDGPPESWPAAPSPVEVAVRPNAGLAGSDRVTIIWADGAIANQWLRVTVKAGAATGLAEDDVFCFGNLVGDADGDGVVDASDYTALKTAWGFGAALPEESADFDCGGTVDHGDLKALAGNMGQSLNLAFWQLPGDAAGDGVADVASAASSTSDVSPPVEEPPGPVEEGGSQTSGRALARAGAPATIVPNADPAASLPPNADPEVLDALGLSARRSHAPGTPTLGPSHGKQPVELTAWLASVPMPVSTSPAIDNAGRRGADVFRLASPWRPVSQARRCVTDDPLSINLHIGLGAGLLRAR